MIIFVKNKDIKSMVEELRECIEFKKISLGSGGIWGVTSLITINDYKIEIHKLFEGSRGLKSDFIVYDDDVTWDELNILIYPMGVRSRDDELEPIVITYKQLLKIIKLFK